MITFPHAKINLGLFVCHKRPSDGYHILQTLFYPIEWRDALEIIPEGNPGECRMVQTGLTIDGDPEQNLCVKAYRRLQHIFPDIPGCTIHLEKRVPFGAGLGGGSSDGAYTLVMLRDMFKLPASDADLEREAAAMGADCAFFVRCAKELSAQYCEGIGHELEPHALSLKGCWIVVVKPPFGVSTKEAYSNVHPQWPATPLCDLLQLPVEQWKDCVRNDFEDSVFPLHPELQQVKDTLYAHGAVYASMSGSGSACFGIFNEEPSAASTWFAEGYETFIHPADRT
ncbi:MAG: 4-(cytidine 5'-diphospho)-2-C-methyl-D-erythritol kinase [Bacteroidales bacterium]|nr:4-(cytidine 5'-diphospho)-2-C-methyl-D-erythritol kinase [Candidatus Liminaster caballi]